MPEMDFRQGGAGGGERGPEGPAGPKGEFNFRGAWVVTTVYAKGDAVTKGGITYACTVAHTAEAANEPPNAGFWAVLAEKGGVGPEGPKGTTGNTGAEGPKGEMLWRGAWSGATEYAKGDAVEEGGSSYVSVKAGNLNHKPSLLGEWWALVAKAGAGVSALEWVNVEAVNASLTQTVTIQVAVFNGLVFMRGLGKVTAEIAAKGILFTLPVAARPAVERNLLYNTSLGTAVATLKIKTTGEVETQILLAVGKTPAFDLSFAL